MTTIVEKIEELTESSVAQTEASQALALEVANKMGSIDLHVNNIEINLNNRINDEIANAVNPELQEAVDVLRDDLTRVETETHRHVMLTMYNRGIITGCDVAVSQDTARTVSVSEGRCFMLGREWLVPAASVSIDDNTGPEMKIYFVVSHTEDGPKISVVTSMTDQAIGLTEITIPSNNTASNDLYGMDWVVRHFARREPFWPIVVSPATHQVPMPNIPGISNYHITIDVLRYIGPSQPVISAPKSARATNTARVYLAGLADRVFMSVSIHKMY